MAADADVETMTTPGSNLTVTGVGPRGPRGPGLLTGHGLPGAQVGLNARQKDLYLDLNSGEVYGPYAKATDTWPATPIIQLGGGGGQTAEQVQALVAAAVATLPPSGLSASQVQALIATAVSNLPSDGVSNLTQVSNAIATALEGYFTKAEATALFDHRISKTVWGVVAPYPSVVGYEENLFRGKFFLDEMAGYVIDGVAYAISGWSDSNSGYSPFILPWDIEQDRFLDPIVIKAPDGAPLNPAPTSILVTQLKPANLVYQQAGSGAGVTAVAYKVVGAAYTAPNPASSVKLAATVIPGFDYDALAADGDGSVGQYVVFALPTGDTADSPIGGGSTSTWRQAWGFDPFLANEQNPLVLATGIPTDVILQKFDHDVWWPRPEAIPTAPHLPGLRSWLVDETVTPAVVIELGVTNWLTGDQQYANNLRLYIETPSTTLVSAADLVDWPLTLDMQNPDGVWGYGEAATDPGGGWGFEGGIYGAVGTKLYFGGGDSNFVQSLVPVPEAPAITGSWHVAPTATAFGIPKDGWVLDLGQGSAMGGLALAADSTANYRAYWGAQYSYFWVLAHQAADYSDTPAIIGGVQGGNSFTIPNDSRYYRLSALYAPTDQTSAMGYGQPELLAELPEVSHFFFGIRSFDWNAGEKWCSYDTVTGQFATLADLPVGASYNAWAVADGKVWYAGGDYSQFAASAFLHSYNPATDAWTSHDVTQLTSDVVAEFDYHGTSAKVFSVHWDGDGAGGVADIVLPETVVAGRQVTTMAVGAPVLTEADYDAAGATVSSVPADLFILVNTNDALPIDFLPTLPAGMTLTPWADSQMVNMARQAWTDSNQGVQIGRKVVWLTSGIAYDMDTGAFDIDFKDPLNGWDAYCSVIEHPVTHKFWVVSSLDDAFTGDNGDDQSIRIFDPATVTWSDGPFQIPEYDSQSKTGWEGGYGFAFFGKGDNLRLIGGGWNVGGYVERHLENEGEARFGPVALTNEAGEITAFIGVEAGQLVKYVNNNGVPGAGTPIGIDRDGLNEYLQTQTGYGGNAWYLLYFAIAYAGYIPAGLNLSSLQASQISASLFQGQTMQLQGDAYAQYLQATHGEVILHNDYFNQGFTRIQGVWGSLSWNPYRSAWLANGKRWELLDGDGNSRFQFTYDTASGEHRLGLANDSLVTRCLVSKDSEPDVLYFRDSTGTDHNLTAPSSAAGGGNANVIETVNQVPAATGVVTLPAPSAATMHNVTQVGNCTLVLPDPVPGATFLVAVGQDDVGGHTTAWSGPIIWPDGAAPTLDTGARKVSIVSFLCLDGVNYLGTPPSS